MGSRTSSQHCFKFSSKSQHVFSSLSYFNSAAILALWSISFQSSDLKYNDWPERVMCLMYLCLIIGIPFSVSPHTTNEP